MKKSVAILVVAALSLVAFGTAAFAAEKRIPVKVTSYYPPSHPVSKSIEFFKEVLERDSKGAFDVQYYPNSQLGPEEVFIDHIKRNTVQVAIAGGLTKKDEVRLTLVEPPFVVETWKQAFAVYNGPIGEKVKGDYTKNTGVLIPGFMVNGFREISSTVPITSMEDFKKVKLRVPTTDLYVNLFKALGVNTVMMPMSEVYNALETKVVDGQDNPYPTVKSTGWWEVQKYMLESHHMFTANPVLVNGKFHKGLNAEQRAQFDKALKETIEYNWQISEKEDDEARQFLKDKGLTVHVPSAEFRQAMKASLTEFYDWFYKTVPGAKEIVAEMEATPK